MNAPGVVGCVSHYTPPRYNLIRCSDVRHMIQRRGEHPPVS